MTNTMNKQIETIQQQLLLTLKKPYGQHYDSNLEIKQITKNIRKELKGLTKLGFKFSVRSEWGSLTVAIRVRVLIIPEDWILFNPHYNQELAWKISVGQITSWETGKDPREVYTELGKQFGKTLRTLCNQWNYDKSDTQTDYFDTNYYLQISSPQGSMM